MASKKTGKTGRPRTALKLLIEFVKGRGVLNDDEAATLLVADLISRTGNGAFAITEAGRGFLARALAGTNNNSNNSTNNISTKITSKNKRNNGRNNSNININPNGNISNNITANIDPFLRQHLALARRKIDTDTGPVQVTVDDSESPLIWLARRKGRDGRPLIEPAQLQAGERLRAEFTRAQMTPRVTSNWTAAVADHPRSAPHGVFTEVVIAARQRVRNALDAVGPEFAGLLLDVCCFLKRLEDVERERAWPQRSGKVVLQLALDRLARHYGYDSELRGHAHAVIRTWLEPDAAFTVGEY